MGAATGNKVSLSASNAMSSRASVLRGYFWRTPAILSARTDCSCLLTFHTTCLEEASPSRTIGEAESKRMTAAASPMRLGTTRATSWVHG